MKPEDVDWVSTYERGARPWPKEERPYRNCPNCGRSKFRYRWHVHHGIPFIGTTKDRFYEYCDNCKYKTNEEVRER